MENFGSFLLKIQQNRIFWFRKFVCPNITQKHCKKILFFSINAEQNSVKRCCCLGDSCLYSSKINVGINLEISRELSFKYWERFSDLLIWGKPFQDQHFGNNNKHLRCFSYYPVFKTLSNI